MPELLLFSFFACLPSYTQMLCVDSIFKALQGFMSKIIFLRTQKVVWIMVVLPLVFKESLILKWYKKGFLFF